MARLPDARDGKLLKIYHQRLDFSLWPMKKSSRRYGLQSRVFISDPWGIIRYSIETKCLSASKTPALAFCEQAEDYFKAASVSGLVAAKPVLLYYSMLNLAKAFGLTRKTRPIYGNKAYHGLAERIPIGGQDFIDSILEAIPSSNRNINIFDDFYKSLNAGNGLSSSFNYEMKYLIPQIVQAHRLWCSSSNERERFIPIYKIDLMQDTVTKSLWLDLFVRDDELYTKGISRKQFLDEAQLDFREVKCTEQENGRKLICFEQNSVINYSHRPSDKVQELVSTIKNNLWVTALSVPPYRKYYTYLSPSSEVNHRLPQIVSLYAVFYYFGSLTRYRPYNFEKILSKPYGGFIREIIETVPNQFLYLLASEFCKQEISKPSIV